MNYFDLVNLIKDKCDSSNNKDIEVLKEKLEIIRCVIGEYTNGGKEGLFTCFTSDLLLAFLVYKNPDSDLSLLRAEAEVSEDFINNLDAGHLISIFSVVDGERAAELIHAFETTFSSPDGGKLTAKEIRKKHKEFMLGLGDVKIFDLSDMDKLKDFMNLVTIMRDIDDSKAIYDIAFIEYKYDFLRKTIINNPILNDRGRTKTLKKLYSDHIVELKKELATLYDYESKLQDELNKKNKASSKRLHAYRALLKKLEVAEGISEVTDIDGIIGSCIDEDVKNACLAYIYQHNQSYYDTLNDEYNKSGLGLQAEYVKFFDSKGISFFKINPAIQQQLLEKGIPTLKAMYKCLKGAGLEDDLIINILARGTLEDTLFIDELIKKGFLDTAWVIKNTSLFYNKESMDNFKSNVGYLLDHSVHLIKIGNVDALIASHGVLVENMELLSKYEITLTSGKVSSLNMLTRNDLESFMESFNELGLLDVVKKNPDLLNQGYHLITRIKLSLALGLPILEDGVLKEEVVDGSLFLISDNKIEDYSSPDFIEFVKNRPYGK